MTYTLGPTHSIAGTGSFVAIAPIGLLAVTTVVPSTVGSRVAVPTAYYGLGSLRPGSANGWYRAERLQTAAHLLYPLPDMVTRVGYKLPPGVSTIVTELLGPPASNVAVQPWDRAATMWSQVGTQVVSPGVGETQMWTYTVPTGRKLWLARAVVRAYHYAAPTSVGAVATYMYLGGALMLDAELRIGTVGTVVEDYQNGAQLVLSAGQVVQATYKNQDTGGGAICFAQAHGFTFDA